MAKLAACLAHLVALSVSLNTSLSYGQPPPNSTHTCPSGYTGEDCSELCEDGRWGVGCVMVCRCWAPVEVCDKAEGVCHSGCQAGWRGADCHTRDTNVQPEQSASKDDKQTHDDDDDDDDDYWLKDHNLYYVIALAVVGFILIIVLIKLLVLSGRYNRLKSQFDKRWNNNVLMFTNSAAETGDDGVRYQHADASGQTGEDGDYEQPVVVLPAAGASTDVSESKGKADTALEATRESAVYDEVHLSNDYINQQREDTEKNAVDQNNLEKQKQDEQRPDSKYYTELM